MSLRRTWWSEVGLEEADTATQHPVEEFRLRETDIHVNSQGAKHRLALTCCVSSSFFRCRKN